MRYVLTIFFISCLAPALWASETLKALNFISWRVLNSKVREQRVFTDLGINFAAEETAQEGEIIRKIEIPQKSLSEFCAAVIHLKSIHHLSDEVLPRLSAEDFSEMYVGNEYLRYDHSDDMWTYRNHVAFWKHEDTHPAIVQVKRQASSNFQTELATTKKRLQAHPEAKTPASPTFDEEVRRTRLLLMSLFRFP